MAIETSNFISGLVPTNPLAGDPISQGDDHIRLIKATLQKTFPDADSEQYVPATPSSAGSTPVAEGGRWVENTTVKTDKSGKLTATTLEAATVDVTTVNTANFTTTEAEVNGTLKTKSIEATGNVNVTGTVDANKVQAPSVIANNITTAQAITCATLSATGNISSSATITAQSFKGDGSQLTNLPIDEVDAYTKSQSDSRFQAKGSYAAATHNHAGVYQPVGNYALVGASYTKTESNSNYAAKSHNHAGVYQPAGNYAAATHNHAGLYQETGNYALRGECYTTSQSDAKYALKGQTGGGTTYSAGNGLQLNGTQFLMSGSFSGDFTATGNVTAYSDDRLKVRDGEVVNALGKVKEIDTFYYTPSATGEYVGMPDKRNAGVSAQQVQEVFPEAVIESEGYLAVDYGRLVILCLEAIKQLSEDRD